MERTILSNYQLATLRYVTKHEPDWQAVSGMYQATVLSLFNRGFVKIVGKQFKPTNDGREIVDGFTTNVVRRKRHAGLSQSVLNVMPTEQRKTIMKAAAAKKKE